MYKQTIYKVRIIQSINKSISRQSMRQKKQNTKPKQNSIKVPMS